MRNLRKADAEEAFAQRDHDDPLRLAAEAWAHWGEIAWVVYSGGEPVAVFGATRMWGGVWGAWLLATDDFPKVGLFVTKFIQRRMIPFLVEQGAHRCEARSLDSHKRAHEWLEALGAEREGLLWQYGKGGEDFAIYRWLRDVVK